jgi:hypothetical protein
MILSVIATLANSQFVSRRTVSLKLRAKAFRQQLIGAGEELGKILLGARASVGGIF